MTLPPELVDASKAPVPKDAAGRMRAFEDFALMTLRSLEDMTSDEFSKGGDRHIRLRARMLLGMSEED